MLVADFETFLIAPGAQFPQAVVTSWYDGGEDGVLTHANPALPGHSAEAAWTDILRRAVQDRTPLGGHNLAFDLGVAGANWPQLLGPIFQLLGQGLASCTLIRERLRNIALRGGHGQIGKGGKYRKAVYDLGTLSRIHRLPKVADKDDPWRLRYSELWDVPLSQWLESAQRYAKDDAIITWLLWHWQNDNTDPAVFRD